MLKKGLRVKVYDGDFIGFTTAVLTEQFSVVQAGALEKWIIETEDGTTLIRYIKEHTKAMKDGCGYLLESFNDEILNWSLNFADKDNIVIVIDTLNELYKGKEFRYISNLGFVESFKFEYISADNFQVNGIYNPSNCYCMEV